MAILERNDTGAVAQLKLNAPDRLNALSDEMLAALQTEFDALREDTSIRAITLSGAGKAFCAGHDLKQMQAGRQAEDGGAAYFADLFSRCATMMMSIRSLPQPVIAMPHGIATAAGCQLVAPCDMAVAAGVPVLAVVGAVRGSSAPVYGELVSLSDRYGTAAAMADTVRLVAEAVSDFLEA